MNREGRRFARLFRQALDLREERQCNLEEIASQDDLEIIEFRDPDPGCTACLYPSPDGSGGGIFLEPDQLPGRRRFSIAHELAHFHIPTHELQGRPCQDQDLQANEGYRAEVEWEANSFAAELLMPETLFRRDSRDREVSFETVYDLASEDMYHVSATAAAIRLVEITNESCALIAMEDGEVMWQVWSDFYHDMASSGQSIRTGTRAAAVFDGADPNSRIEPVEGHSWFDDPDDADVPVLETTHAIPSLGQVLSLLWVPDRI